MTGNKAKMQLFKKNKIYYLYTASLALLLTFSIWGAFALMIGPEYRASSQLLIEESAPVDLPHPAENVSVDTQVIEAYASFATSPEILERVKGKLNLNHSITEIQQKIDVDYTSNSPVLTVTAVSENKQQAALIANSLSSVFQSEVRTLLQGDHVTIISQASSVNIDAGPSQKWLLLTLPIAAVMGLSLSILTTFLVRAIKDVINSADRDTRNKENQMQTVFK